MHSIFPQTLVDCVRSGKSPTREQITAVALHIWRDWCCGFGLECDGMPRDPDLTHYLRSLAWMALTGEADGPPAYRENNRNRKVESIRSLAIAC